MEFSKCVRRHQVTKAPGRPAHPFSFKYGVTTSVRPFCMSTTVPYWSNMHTVIFAFSSFAAMSVTHQKIQREPEVALNCRDALG